MTHREIAAAIQQGLGLADPPVGIAFVQAPPAGIAPVAEDVPSGCSFWRRAEQGVFYAPPESHFNCPVGAHVLGFDLPPAQQQELMGLVGAMAEAQYFDPAEAARLPTVRRPKAGIVYGPLADLPLAPDLVVCWVDPTQAMLLAEAAGTSLWANEAGIKTLGRPGCAALPTALDEGRATLSLGCAGMRVYTEVARAAMLVVLPLAQAEQLAQELPRVVAANTAITRFHEERKGTLAASG
jgi:uncharacterized protein (DUF169 family)